jgi:hypothetical protein
VDLARGLETLLVAGVVAALAPAAGGPAARPAHPQVVILLAGGVVIGPEVLGWADRANIDLLAMSASGSCSCWPATSSTSTCSGSVPGGWPWSPGW